MRPRYSRSDYVRAIRIVITNHLRRTKRRKADLAFNVLHTQYQGLLSRRLLGKSEWRIEELDAVARYFGLTIVEFWIEVYAELIEYGLDTVENPMVG